MVRRDLHKEFEVDLESETSDSHTGFRPSQDADPDVSSTLGGHMLPFVVSEGNVCAHQPSSRLHLCVGLMVRAS